MLPVSFVRVFIAEACFCGVHMCMGTLMFAYFQWRSSLLGYIFIRELSTAKTLRSDCISFCSDSRLFFHQTLFYDSEGNKHNLNIFNTILMLCSSICIIRLRRMSDRLELNITSILEHQHHHHAVPLVECSKLVLHSPA